MPEHAEKKELARILQGPTGLWSDNAVLRGDGTGGIQGSQVTIDDSGYLAVQALDRIYVDGGGGGGDTFLVESAANQLDIVVGGEIVAVFDGSTPTKLTTINDDVTMSGTVSIGILKPAQIDAKGDLLAGTADETIARLAVGANGKVLTAASGETTGLKYDVIGEREMVFVALSEEQAF